MIIIIVIIIPSREFSINLDPKWLLRALLFLLLLLLLP